MKIVISSSEEKKTYTYNDENQLEKIETDDGFITYRYDDNGNITHRINEDGSKEVYRYDREDQLIHVQKGEDIYKYAYDAEGERITEMKVDVRDYPMLTWYNYTVNMEFEDVKKDHNETFEMLREQVAKREANDNTCDVVVTAHKETTYRKDPEITYYTLDRNQEHTVVLQENGESNVYANEEIVLSGDDKQVIGLNGSVIAEVDEDEEITIHSYSDYGVSNTKEEGHAYNGEYVQSNGLIYLRARYYDPTIGNFIQIDNNYAGEAENVATQNRYNYTLSNPYQYVDKDGNKVSRKPKSKAKQKPSTGSSLVTAVTGIGAAVKKTMDEVKSTINTESGPETGFVDTYDGNNYWAQLFGAIGAVAASAPALPAIPIWGLGLIGLFAFGVLGCFFPAVSGITVEDTLDFGNDQDKLKNWETFGGDQELSNLGYETYPFLESGILAGTGGVALTKSKEDELKKNASTSDKKDKNSTNKNKLKAEDLERTNTVNDHLDDFVGKDKILKIGEDGGYLAVQHAGEAARPYIDSTQLIQEIMDNGTPVKDLFLTNGLKWIVPGSFRGTTGVWELIVDLDSNRIVHFLFNGK
jgi:RHS repeat-associated protein